MSEQKPTLILLLIDGGIEVEYRDEDIFPDELWDYLWDSDEVYQFVTLDNKGEKDLESTEEVEGRIIRLSYLAGIDSEIERDEITWNEWAFPYIDGTLLEREVIGREFSAWDQKTEE